MKRAVLVIDMLYDFIHPEGALYCEDGKNIINQTEIYLQAHRRQGDMIVYVCDRHTVDDEEFQRFPPHAVDGTRGAEVISSLAPKKEDPIIPKRRYSGFFGTPLDLTLREKGITSLILMGVCTHICILYTAADARNLGYEVTIYADAVAGLSFAAHQWALYEMEHTLGCQVLPCMPLS